MGRVIIGMDPHKRSATIEVIDERETGPGAGPVRHRPRRLPGDARRRPAAHRTGSGRSRAATASAGTSPSAWSPTARPSWTCRRSCPPGRGCSPPARAARPTRSTRTAWPWSRLRTPGLRQVAVDDTTVALRLLVDRRDELGRARTEIVNRLHHLLLELVPGGAKKFLSAPQARALLRHRAGRVTSSADPPPAGLRTDRRTRRHRQEDQGRERSS